MSPARMESLLGLRSRLFSCDSMVQFTTLVSPSWVPMYEEDIIMNLCHEMSSLPTLPFSCFTYIPGDSPPGLAWKGKERKGVGISLAPTPLKEAKALNSLPPEAGGQQAPRRLTPKAEVLAQLLSAWNKWERIRERT